MRGTLAEYDRDGRMVIAVPEQKIKPGAVVDVTQHREKRSLDANAYFHLLVGKLAAAMELPNPFVKTLLLRRYGQFETEGQELTTVLIKTRYEAVNDLRTEIHLNPFGYTVVSGEMYTMYHVMRGSHTYNSEEMARLIDGTVSECRELGIETMTPAELAKLKYLEGGEKD